MNRIERRDERHRLYKQLRLRGMAAVEALRQVGYQPSHARSAMSLASKMDRRCGLILRRYEGEEQDLARRRVPCEMEACGNRGILYYDRTWVCEGCFELLMDRAPQRVRMAISE